MKTNKTKQINGVEVIVSPSDEQKKEWKSTYGKVAVLEVGDKKIYARHPGRKEIGDAITHSGGNPLEIGVACLRYCLLGGNVEVLDDDASATGVALAFQSLIRIKEVRLGEL